MGYYTRFELHVVHDANTYTDAHEIIAKLNSISKYSFSGLGHLGEELKWYDHDKDMCQLSFLYPNILFELIGEGEESGDMWKTYYVNGKDYTAKAVITYPGIDLSELKRLTKRKIIPPTPEQLEEAKRIIAAQEQYLKSIK